MKNVKFSANDLLESLNMELNQEEINEIYKAFIAYNLGFAEITPEIDEKLDKTINWYLETDYIAGIMNEDVIHYAYDLFDEEMEG